MDPQRHRRRAAREPLWGSTRLLVFLAVLVVVLGVLVGVATTRSSGRERQAAPSSTATPPTSSVPAPTTSVAPPTSSTPPTTLPRPTTTSPTSISSSSITTVPPTSVKPDLSILQQRRPAPDGVLKQMLSTFGGAGGGVCDESSSRVDPNRIERPTIVIGTDQRPNFTVREIAEPIQLCLWRFAADDPIHVTVGYPNGRVATSLGYPPGHPPGNLPCISDNCYSHVNWAAVPGDPLGDYQITAVQGRLRAAGMVRVVPATVRRLLVVGNGVDEQQYQTFRRGATIPIAAAGYPSLRGVQLFIYYTPERALQLNVPELRFLTWVELRTDSHGAIVYGLHTVADDPPGCYVLDTRPRAQEFGPVLDVDPVTHEVMLIDKDTAPLFCLA